MATSEPFYPGMRITDFATLDLTVERVGRGSAFVDLFGTDRLFDRRVVLKTLRPDLPERPALRERFIDAGLTWIGLWPHPNVVAARTMVEIEGRAYLVLEYAPHGSLRDLLNHLAQVNNRGQQGEATNRLPREIALAWAQCIAAGLAHIHAPDPKHLRNVPLVHGDLKPENVLIAESGLAMISDIGMFVALAGVASDTPSGSIVGTPPYLPPERWYGSRAMNPADDVYALGLILSELLAGRHALLDLDAHYSLEQWRQAHRDPRPRPLRELVPDLPQRLENLYQACLSPEPTNRPTAAQVLAELRAAARDVDQDTYIPQDVQHTARNEIAYWAALGGAFSHVGRSEQALMATDRALQFDPQDAELLMRRGYALQVLRRPEEAVTTFDQALAVAPRDPQQRYLQVGALRGRADAQAEMGRYPEAIASLDQAGVLEPANPSLAYQRATNDYNWSVELARQGKRAEALERARYAIVHATSTLGMAPDFGQARGLRDEAQRLMQALESGDEIRSATVARGPGGSSSGWGAGDVWSTETGNWGLASESGIGPAGGSASPPSPDTSDLTSHKDEVARLRAILQAAGALPSTSTTSPDSPSSPSLSLDSEVTLERVSDAEAEESLTPQANDESRSADSPDDGVLFTAFYPRIVAVDVHYTLAIYTHIAAAIAEVRQDVLRFSDEMRDEPHEVGAPALQPLTRGVILTIVPACEGVTFNPEYVTFKWMKDRERTTFDFVADRRLAGSAVNAEVTIYAGPVIIGILRLPLVCDAHETTSPHDDEQATATAHMLRSVFASYSHDDEPIVIACRNAYTALGLKFWRDRDDLDSGQLWEPGLEDMIRKADVFQLFWSPQSSQSPYVRKEWEFALGLQRTDDFIRPVFWEQPLAPVPQALSKLNFRYMPLARLGEASHGEHVAAAAKPATSGDTVGAEQPAWHTAAPVMVAPHPAATPTTPPETMTRPRRKRFLGIFPRRS